MEAAKIELIEEQLNDLLSMLGCPEKSTKGPCLSDSNMFSSVISPLERILKTKPIWHCPDVTREEAVRLLQNKKIGNFIVRGSRQPQTLALSVRLTDRENFPPVQHFIIIIRGRKVAMEDSDLQFDNIVSLAFHYTQVCDELPERLSLPDVLASASSLQNLVSLSLLGKSFWSYPMAKSERSSLALAEETSQEGREENKETAPLTRTPPRPPNRSRTSSQPQPHPVPHPRSKARRKSDSVPFIISPARVARPARHSLADLYRPPGLANSDWVTSPVFTNGGRDSPPVSSSRTRKVSVFYNKLGHVEEDEEVHEEVHEDYSNPSRPIRGQYSGHVTCPDQSEDEDEDYAFPLDAIKEDEDHSSLYENPHQPIRDELSSSGPIRGQDSDTGSDLGNGSLLRPEGEYRFDRHSPLQQRSSPQGDRRKLSLGVILRKLSTGSQPGRERKTSLQERRLSSALSKLITPIFERRTLGERSYQVNSLSWEFLNKDAEEECLEGQIIKTDKEIITRDKEIITRDKQEEVSDKLTLVMKHPSTDSLYESEFDSSSTLESTNSITSTRFQHQQQHVNNIVIQ